MGLLKRLLIRQCRRPSGWLGEYITFQMNRRHSQLTGWGLSHLSPKRDWTALDIGCGGGKTVARLAALTPAGHVEGVDASPKSVAVSQRTNRAAIRDGHVRITLASVSNLPFPDAGFDCATAVETHYFWPNFVTDLQEVRRVLKPEGVLLLLAEVYRCEKFDARNQQWLHMLPMAYYSPEQFRTFFTEAGFTDVVIDEEPNEGWLCCIGRNPGSSEA